MPFLDSRRLHQIDKVFPLVQPFREDHPEQSKTWCKSWSWLFFGIDPMLIGGELALCGQESGGQHGLGAEHGPQKDQDVSGQFTSAGKHATNVYQKAFNGVHDAKIMESDVYSKFT